MTEYCKTDGYPLEEGYICVKMEISCRHVRK